VGIERATPASLALYHAFRYNYPQVHDSIIVVNVGARTTSLLFMEGERFYVRTLPLAGNTVTQSISEDLRIDFGSAETLKIQVLSGRSDLPAASPSRAAVQRAAAAFISKLHVEITRSAVNHRRHSGSGAAVAVYLTGGGSLLDYLGYGTTLSTWYQDGRRPLEVTATVDEPRGLEVDEHSIVVARYAHGLSKFETRWGTFTDPWTIQPQPKCGFVVAGTEGTVSTYDYDDYVTVQTRKKLQPHRVAAPATKPPHRNPVQYLIHCLEKEVPLEGPVSLPISRIGQEIVDAAVRSAKLKKTVRL
jgi:hypothetical protein